MILILNGPNLNLLGTRQPEIYGHTTLADLEALCQDWAEELGLSINFQQSNYEGQLIDWIHAAREQEVKGIVINPGGYTHTSVAIRDAIAGVGIPAIEVHISNVFAREPFRHHSYIAPVCIGSIAGLGMEGYKAALMKFQALLG
ncbi:MAG: type II 3-dehydroquinate dehydratase [Meiothermus sp.]|nr:type II 3-dehydroquinate dehydratase [Meiothermus sp.]